jgi:putative hydrolase of the HAD superfamily
MVVFFDIDDTLIDHGAALRSAATSVHAGLKLGVPVQDFLAAWQAALLRYYPLYLKGEITYEVARRARIRETIDPALADTEADDLFASYLARYEAAWTLFPDVLPCLDRLMSFRLGIISNGRSDEQRKKLGRFGLVGRFEHILISEECGVAKPDQKIFRWACAAVRVSPAEALYIGDQYEIDVCGARNAGLEGIWLDRHGTASADNRPPVVRSLDELMPETLS